MLNKFCKKPLYAVTRTLARVAMGAQPAELESTLICSVIGTHTGPGVVAVAFFRKNGQAACR